MLELLENRRKEANKKKMFEAKLRENTDEINRRKDFAKKRKTAL